MKSWLEIYYAHLKISLAVQFQYRVGMMIWMIEIILEPVIYLVVWQAAAGGGAISDYSAGDFAGYFIVLLVVNHFTQMWHMWEYEWRIRQGELSRLLLRPQHPIHADIAQNLSYKAFMLVIIVPTLIILALLFDPIIAPPLWSALAFVPAVIIAGGLAFMTGWIVAMAAFWTVRIVAVNDTYILLMLFFSGRIAPLEVLPDSLQTIAAILPFRWTIAFPTELALGRLTPEQALNGFGLQLVWCLACYTLMGFVWRQAIKRYGAVGG